MAITVDEIDATRLRKNRRRFTDAAHIDGACVQAFEQLRPSGKFQPLHADALACEPLFERAARLEHDKVPVFLKADPQPVVRALCASRACREWRKRREQPAKRGARHACAGAPQQLTPVGIGRRRGD